MKLLLTFTYNVSLDLWYKSGVISREVSLYRKISEKKNDVIFLTFGDDNDLKYADLLNGIKIVPALNYVRAKNRKISYLKLLLLPLRVKEIIKNIDIIKTNQLEGSWGGWIAKILYRKKFIVRGGFEWLKFYILENELSNKRKNFKYWLQYFWRYFVEFISYKLADRIILTNPTDIDFIIKKFQLKRKKQKIQHFYNHIDIDLFKPLNTEKKDKHILFIGRLHQQKNIDNLFKAFMHLKDFTLDIVGNVSNKILLVDKINQFGINVNFLGVIPNNRLPEIFNQYQIFILPSFYEGNPKVLLEAMSCGLACIGTNVWGISNIINHKENGYLCETDANSIRNAIVTLYNNRELMKKIGQEAREFIVTNCSLESIANKEYLLYKSLFI